MVGELSVRLLRFPYRFTFLDTGVIVSEAIYPPLLHNLQDPLGRGVRNSSCPILTLAISVLRAVEPAPACNDYINITISIPRVSDRTMRQEWLFPLLGVRTAGRMKIAGRMRKSPASEAQDKWL
jgi:hypothetical protein